MKSPLLVALIIMLAGAGKVAAGDPTPDRPRESGPEPQGKLIEVGIFATSGLAIRYNDPGSSTGRSKGSLGPISLVTATNHIPAKEGITFGIRYLITGLADTHGQPVDLIQSISHPPMNVPGRGVNRGSTNTAKLRVRSGVAMGWIAYTLDKPYELVPGVWVFEISMQGRLLIRQLFQVVPASPDAGKF